MTYDWQRILGGPRGRQLCLESAIAAEREQLGDDEAGPLGHAEFYLGVGQPGRQYFTFDGPASEPRRTTTEEFLTALAGVDPAPVSDERLPGLLDRVVCEGRYWQAPEHRDEVLTDPRAIELLRPWADQFGSTPSAAWWPSPFDATTQFTVEGPDSGRRRADDALPVIQQLERAWLAEVDGEADAKSTRPADPAANWSGVWWSTPWAGQVTTRLWPDGRLDDDGLTVRDPIGVLIREDAIYPPEDAVWRPREFPRDARILELESAKTWIDLCRQHPVDVSAARRHDWYRCTGRAGDWVVPNWAHVAREWDAVHLPMAGYLELAGAVIPVDDDSASVIAGWSPDETHWLIDLPD